MLCSLMSSFLSALPGVADLLFDFIFTSLPPPFFLLRLPISLTSTHSVFDSAQCSCFLASPNTLKINEGCGERRGGEQGRRRLHSTFQLGSQSSSVCEQEEVHDCVSHVCRDTHVHYGPCSPRSFICLSEFVSLHSLQEQTLKQREGL